MQTITVGDGLPTADACTSDACIRFENLPFAGNALRGADIPSELAGYPYRVLYTSQPGDRPSVVVARTHILTNEPSFDPRGRTPGSVHFHLNGADRLEAGRGVVVVEKNVPAPVSPWARYPDARVEANFMLSVTRLERSFPGDDARGSAIMEFEDRTSRDGVSISIAIVGLAPSIDPPRRRGRTVIIGSAFAEQPKIGTATAGRFIACAPHCAPYGLGNNWYGFDIDRDAFIAALAIARAVNPALSADPADYALTKFGFESAVEGEAISRINVTGPYISIYPE